MIQTDGITLESQLSNANMKEKTDLSRFFGGSRSCNLKYGLTGCVGESVLQERNQSPELT